MCHRSEEFPNPCPKRHKTTGLKFVNRSQCCGCLNYHNSQCCGQKISEVKGFLDADPTGERRIEWTENVSDYELIFDENEGKQLRATADGLIKPPSWITAVSEKGTMGRDTCWHFWPVELLKNTQRSVRV